MSEKIKILIVDDEPEARDILENLLLEIDCVEIVAKANNVETGVEAILQFTPDIVLLDVQMPKRNGFDLIHEIRNINLKPTIVFVTAYNEYAIDAIKHSAFDYLLKPVKLTDLQKTILRYNKEKTQQETSQQHITLLDEIKKNKLRFNTRSGFVLIDINEIAYCQAQGSYTIICKRNKNSETISMNLAQIEELLDGEQFFRIGRSTIININHLSKVDRKSRKCTIELDNEEVELSISRKFVSELRLRI